MSAEPLAVVGAGEHARVVVDAAQAAPDRWTVIGVVTAPSPGGPNGDSAAAMRPGAPDALADLDRLGDDGAFLTRLAGMEAGSRPALVLGVGAPLDPGARRRIVARYGKLARWASVVHPSATVARTVTADPGSVILAGAVVGPGAHLGRHSVVNDGAIVEHDVRVGDFSQVGPGAVIGGAATIGEGVLVGLGARVRDHLAIGADAVIGMGAVVVADVGPGEVVAGVPARPLSAADAARARR